MPQRFCRTTDTIYQSYRRERGQVPGSRDGRRSPDDRPREVERLPAIAAEMMACRTERGVYQLPVAAAERVLAFDVCGIDAIEHGAPDVHIEVGTTDAGFYVADDGSGIPAAHREEVLEYGYSTADGGTGLGLAIVREIAGAHGWTVEVSESEAGGARFDVATA